MKLACPHCSQTLELTPEVLASLQGQPHFECPSCQGLIAVPAQPQRPMPRSPQPQVRAAASQAQRGMNRNLLVLGVVALLVLGGIAAFLASRSGGSITNLFQNTTNNIINNSYFTQLIAKGGTTKADLEALELIRPFDQGYIGISRENLDWPEAWKLAEKAGARVLEPASVGAESRRRLLSWLHEHFSEQLASPAWAQETGQPRLLDGREILAVTDATRKRKVLVHWMPGAEPKGAAASGVVSNDPWTSFDPGPLVFEEAFKRPESLKRMTVFEGQYFGRARCEDGNGVQIVEGHSRTMIWPQALLGDSSRVEFEVELPPKGNAEWVMKGAGLGNSVQLGLTLLLKHDVLFLRLAGREHKRQKLPSLLPPDAWASVQTDMRGGHLAVRINGTLVLTTTVPDLPQDARLGWLGLSGTRPTYRNLRVWSTETDQTRQPVLVPAAGTEPRPNGEELFRFAEADGPLSDRWSQYDAAQIRVEKEALFLNAYATNGWPTAFLKQPFHGPVAVEFTHVLGTPRTMNLIVSLAFASSPPVKMREVEELWQISLPNHDSSYHIKWKELPGKTGTLNESWQERFANQEWTNTLASTDFHPPKPNHPYRVRLEFTLSSTRIFLDGHLLLETSRPADAAPLRLEEPYYLGFHQVYSDSLISDLRVFKIAEK